MSGALATAYDRAAMPDEILNAAAAARAYDELEQHGGALTRPAIAERWGVTQQNVDAMSRRPGFPKPWLTFGRSALYLYAEVLAWRRLELERPGKPGPPPMDAAAILEAPAFDPAAARRAAARVIKHGGLAAAAALGERYGMTRQAIQQHAAKDGFPAERTRANSAPLYLLAEADAWNRARTRKSGE